MSETPVRPEFARRSIAKAFLASLAGLGAAFAASRAQAQAPAPGKLKVAYHLADADKVDFVIGNIRNHIDGIGGADKVEIVLVVHGPALKAFHDLAATDKTKASLAKFKSEGVGLHACANTMRAQAVKLDDLLPGFIVAEQGGVVRLAELQSKGFVYLRP